MGLRKERKKMVRKRNNKLPVFNLNYIRFLLFFLWQRKSKHKFTFFQPNGNSFLHIGLANVLLLSKTEDDTPLSSAFADYK